MSAEPKTVQTSLAALRTQPTQDNLPTVRAGFDSQAGFELMQRGAKALAASTLVPETYHGNLPNCIIALNMASRMGADPMMVMQNLYVVHGRPGWSSQFLIASFNQCGRFTAIRYEFTGTEGKDDWSCRAYATEKSSGEVIKGPLISIALAKAEGWYQKNGSKWKTLPQLMLMYRAAAWLVRTHAPEISMGLQTAEEAYDVYEAQRGDNGQFSVTLDDLKPGAPTLPAEVVATAAETVETQAPVEADQG